MPGPPEATAACRLAVRRALADLPPDAPVAAAVSGGADSLALAAALAFERPGAGAVVVDHQLQAGSAEVAAGAAEQCRGLGLRADVVAVVVEGTGEGPARTARLAALEASGATVLLGHTLDDQAETVLLGLARGSGGRALAGMAAVRGPFRRPFLGLRRDLVRRACMEAGLRAWEDPHNSDPVHARVRVRSDALPALEAALGPGVVTALARSAERLREDADALDALAAPTEDVADLLELPAALRSRALKLLAEDVSGAAVTSAHVAALRALVEDWHGQGPVALPGGARLGRVGLGRTARLASPPVMTGPETASGTTPPSDRVVPPHLTGEIESVLVSESQIRATVADLARRIDEDYAGRELLLVGVLKGAVMIMADLARALQTPSSMEFMAVSSYGSATTSSGVVRILKDLDRDITGRHVLVVEDIIDSGLTLSWLLRNLSARQPASIEVVALLRKPEAKRLSDLGRSVQVRYVGHEIPDEFVVGYGLDVAERYRDLPFVGTLKRRAVSG